MRSVAHQSVALALAATVAAACVSLTGCQDTVSIGFQNPCSVDVEVLEENIRLGDDGQAYHVVNVGAIEKVLVDSPDWESVQLRVRRRGSESIGDLLVVDRSQATVPDDDSLGFVIPMDPVLCAQLP